MSQVKPGSDKRSARGGGTEAESGQVLPNPRPNRGFVRAEGALGKERAAMMCWRKH